MNIWILNGIICLLSVVNAVSWGYCVKEVGSPHLTIKFLFKLAFNRFFISAMGSALLAVFVKYNITHDIGVMKTWFFVATSQASVVLACYFILGERPSPIEWVGIGLIMVGVLILGR